MPYPHRKTFSRRTKFLLWVQSDSFRFKKLSKLSERKLFEIVDGAQEARKVIGKRELKARHALTNIYYDVAHKHDEADITKLLAKDAKLRKWYHVWSEQARVKECLRCQILLVDEQLRDNELERLRAREEANSSVRAALPDALCREKYIIAAPQ